MKKTYGNISVRYDLIHRLITLTIKKSNDYKRPSVRELATEALERYLKLEENKDG